MTPKFGLDEAASHGKVFSTITTSEDIPTLASDYVKIFIDNDCQICTFMFFKRHPIAKNTQKEVIIESIQDQEFLQVKVPFSTAFALGIYMNEIFEKIYEEHGKRKGFDFGPTYVGDEGENGG